MTAITLPPLPRHPEPHTYQWTELERITLRVMQIQAMRAGMEAAAQACFPCVTADECADEIRALRIEGDSNG